MLLALVLVGITTVLLCRLLFTLASLACPIFIGIVIAEAARGAGASVTGAMSFGFAAGAAALFAGQFLFATFSSAISRVGMMTLFALPAAFAGYNAGHGVAAICGVPPFWQFALGLGAGACVALAAITRLGDGLPASSVPQSITRNPTSVEPASFER